MNSLCHYARAMEVLRRMHDRANKMLCGYAFARAHEGYIALRTAKALAVEVHGALNGGGSGNGIQRKALCHMVHLDFWSCEGSEEFGPLYHRLVEVLCTHKDLHPATKRLFENIHWRESTFRMSQYMELFLFPGACGEPWGVLSM